MIKKMPWPTRKSNHIDVALNKKRNNSYIITNKDYNLGKSLMDATFEANVAPLVSSFRVTFETIPLDGNPQNVNLDNILVSGFGKALGIDKENGMNGEILRLEYDPDDDMFSYVFVDNGMNEEYRDTSFVRLRTKCAHSKRTHSFRNKKYLLTCDEYLAFYRDYATNNVNIDVLDFDICSYKQKK